MVEKRRASFANVTALAALVVALSGSAVAATTSSPAVNSSDLHFGGHEHAKAVVIKPNQTAPMTVDSIRFTVPRVSSGLVNGSFTVTNNSSTAVTVELIVGMNGTSEKYTLPQTVEPYASEQLSVAGLNCNGIPAGKDAMSFQARVLKLANGNVTFGFRTVDLTVWNPRKLSF